MLIAETQVLELGFNLIQPQAIGQRCIDVERLACNLILFVGRLRSQCAHVVQAIADFYEDDADVIAHREQQFFEVFGLCRGFVSKNAATDFG